MGACLAQEWGPTGPVRRIEDERLPHKETRGKVGLLGASRHRPDDDVDMGKRLQPLADGPYTATHPRLLASTMVGPVSRHLFPDDGPLKSRASRCAFSKVRL